MLTIEQFKTSKLSQLYTTHYFDEPLKYQSLIFTLLMEQGVFRQCDPEIIAIYFYSPIYTLLTVCDRHPEREEDAVEKIEKHIRQFIKMYVVKDN